MSSLIIVQSSLNPYSKTSLVVNELVKVLEKKGVNFEVLDLRNFEQEWCDGRVLKDYSTKTREVFKKLSEARGFVFAFPVYQYSFSGVFKNFIDIHGSALSSKPFGIVLNSGGIRSFMSGSSLLLSMFFEYESSPVTPLIHSWSGDFSEGKLNNSKVFEKINQMLESLIKHL